jgi:hypothetical protein
VTKEPALGNIRANWAKLLAVRRMPTMATRNTNGIDARTEPAMNDTAKKRLMAGAMSERLVTVASMALRVPDRRRGAAVSEIRTGLLMSLPPTRTRRRANPGHK